MLSSSLDRVVGWGWDVCLYAVCSGAGPAICVASNHIIRVSIGRHPFGVHDPRSARLGHPSRLKTGTVTGLLPADGFSQYVFRCTCWRRVDSHLVSPGSDGPDAAHRMVVVTIESVWSNVFRISAVLATTYLSIATLLLPAGSFIHLPFPHSPQ